MNCAIGLDFATEGARLILINEKCEILNRFETKLAQVNIGENNSRTQDVKSWITALDNLISQAASFIKNNSLNPVILYTSLSNTILFLMFGVYSKYLTVKLYPVFITPSPFW